MSSTRAAALRVLTEVERGHTTLPRVVERERRGLDDRRDRALLLELAAGTLRWRNAVDAALAQASHRPIADLPAPVRNALRLGAFQLRYLDRIPAHAVIDESVEAVRQCGHPRAAGFVNAVLRTLLRRAAEIVLPARPGPGAPRDAGLDYLTRTLSHPEWLAARWIERYGFDAAEAWCQFNNAPPEIAVRFAAGASLDTVADAALGLRPSRYVAGAFVATAGALGQLPDALRDSMVVQDEGSQLIALAAPAPPGGRVLDLCASPGNKSVVMATRPGARVAVVACDLRPGRVALLRRTLERAGAAVPVVRLDATRPLPFGAAFDTVLVDAPCSGLGTLRRDPDLKWSRRAEDLPRFATRQAAMLVSAADAVRPGGHLVYATCSSEPEENDEVVEAFLAARPAFEAARIELGGAASAAGLVDDRGRLRTLPFRHHLDAFFAAMLVRRRSA